MEYNLIDKNVKLILSQVLTENVSIKIILCSISRYNIKNLIGEKIIKYVTEHPEKKWSMYGLSQNPNITIDCIEKYHSFKWDRCGILINQNTTMEYIEKHPEKECRGDCISCNPNLTIEFIEKNRQMFSSGLRRLSRIARFMNSIQELLEKNDLLDEMFNLDVDWFYISMNQNITLEYINKFPEKKWDWNGISANPNVTIKYIDEHPEKKWNWEGISWNPNITIEYIEKHPEKDWHWDGISRCLFSQDNKKIENYIKGVLFE